ncbi:hypothetical protein H4R24_005564 [Coemansia sp. RSA 988]|nr:hypothetical protein H4R24_005564 [Coemansia sp. RSA 988]
MSDNPKATTLGFTSIATNSDVTMHSEHSLMGLMPEQLVDIFCCSGQALCKSHPNQYTTLMALIVPPTNDGLPAHEATPDMQIPNSPTPATPEQMSGNTSATSQVSTVVKDNVTLFKDMGTKFDGEDIV